MQEFQRQLQQQLGNGRQMASSPQGEQQLAVPDKHPASSCVTGLFDTFWLNILINLQIRDAEPAVAHWTVHAACPKTHVQVRTTNEVVYVTVSSLARLYQMSLALNVFAS